MRSWGVVKAFLDICVQKYRWLDLNVINHESYSAVILDGHLRGVRQDTYGPYQARRRLGCF